MLIYANARLLLHTLQKRLSSVDISKDKGTGFFLVNRVMLIDRAIILMLLAQHEAPLCFQKYILALVECGEWFMCKNESDLSTGVIRRKEKKKALPLGEVEKW